MRSCALPSVCECATECICSGSKKLGLVFACRQPTGFPEWCGAMTNTPREWMVTTCLITAGALVLLGADVCLLLAEWKKNRRFLTWTKLLAAGGGEYGFQL